MLHLLLHSIRERYEADLRILVADDGGAADLYDIQAHGAELLELPENSGLGYGRNALVRSTRTRFFMLLDDDVFFLEATSLQHLVTALDANPDAVLAAGCYQDIRFQKRDCFALRFDTESSGAIVSARVAPASSESCTRVHMAHNFFVARTSALLKFSWDPRQRVMEHETFFYQLFLNGQSVLSCPRVSVGHNTTRDNEYRERSFRLREQLFMQYLCKNFPEVSRFRTPHLLWRCDSRTYCGPAWHAQFAYDGMQCHPMQWDESEDQSVVRRPLVSQPLLEDESFPRAKGGVPALAAHRCRVPLLVLILTEERNIKRRAEQRATWLSFSWHRGYLDRSLVPWRYLYVFARQKSGAAHASMLDEVVGDSVTLGNVTEGYKNLVFKTMEAIRWAIRHVDFDVILKTDDDSMVH
ncbi:MAG: hypothetical protein SGPRY_010135, partial [Prymnesium sp.]